MIIDEVLGISKRQYQFASNLKKGKSVELKREIQGKKINEINKYKKKKNSYPLF